MLQNKSLESVGDVGKKLFTVIVLSYNNLEYLEACIHSVLIQDYPKIQLIIADDGSSYFDCDKIYKYILKYRKDNICNFEVFTNEVNLGTVANINKALRYVKGDYIKLVAADDQFYTDRSISQLVKCFEIQEVNVITSRWATYTQDMNRCKGVYPSKILFSKMKKSSPLKLYQIVATKNAIGAVGVCFKASYLIARGGIDKNYKVLEDWPTWLQLCRSNEKIYFLDEIIEKYREGGICSQTYQKKPNALLLKDMQYMYQEELLKNEKLLAPVTLKEVKFSYKRLFMWGKMSKKDRISTIIKNIDIVIRRKIIKCIEYLGGKLKQ